MAFSDVALPFGIVPAMTLQSFLQEMTLGTVTLAAFTPQGIEPHGMTFANEATLLLVIDLGYTCRMHMPVGELLRVRRNGHGEGGS